LTKSQENIRFLPGDRLLAFSSMQMLIYSFVIAEVEPTVTTLLPDITQPLWDIPLSKTRTGHGSLSQGITNRLGTCFIIHARNQILGLVIPHRQDQAPRSIEMMDFGQLEGLSFAIGFEKGVIQYGNRTVARLGFSWDVEDMGLCPKISCTCVLFRDYPTTPNGARPPKLDEETGRIVQDLIGGVLVIDTALVGTIGKQQ
jgi:hypothetical protein